ncbi:hypothetical protein Y032_0218g2435 [Ancylostoma ceylanicum]|uniref:Transthyretin-like family protein n=1 Tax=Ancylostoma ceylanicum TaxID=53326 RepID=A0A016SJT4_9BILA|nr:hypothetical protein Y032_0218g2435 [Ancylostoma ceylanicum]
MKAVILLLITSSCYSFFDGKQSVGVKGRLTCNGKPARGVLVTYKLFNKRMVSGYTNENGAFKLQSSAIKMPKVKPQLQIDHSCNQKGPHPYKTINMEIPWNPSIWYHDIGTVELSKA